MTKEEEKHIADLVVKQLRQTGIVDLLKNDKEFEKKVKQLANDVIVDLFRVLWMHNNIYKNLSK